MRTIIDINSRQCVKSERQKNSQSKQKVFIKFSPIRTQVTKNGGGGGNTVKASGDG